MSNLTKAAIFMIISSATFSLMQVIIGFTADEIPLFEQLFFRNLVASIVTFFAVKKQNCKIFGEKENCLLLSARAFFGYLAMITTFYASRYGNQADVSTILKMTPFLVTLFAFLFLGEKIKKYQIVSLIVASVGIFFISNPKFNSNVFPLFVAFLALITSSLAYTMIGKLKNREKPEVIIFFFSFTSTIVTIPFMLANFVMPSLFMLFLLFCIGITAAFGQIALTYSYVMAPASQVSIYNYSGIIFSILFAYLLLGQTVKMTSLLGVILVFTSAILVYSFARKDTSLT